MLKRVLILSLSGSFLLASWAVAASATSSSNMTPIWTWFIEPPDPVDPGDGGGQTPDPGDGVQNVGNQTPGVSVQNVGNQTPPAVQNVSLPTQTGYDIYGDADPIKSFLEEVVQTIAQRDSFSGSINAARAPNAFEVTVYGTGLVPVLRDMNYVVTDHDLDDSSDDFNGVGRELAEFFKEDVSDGDDWTTAFQDGAGFDGEHSLLDDTRGVQLVKLERRDWTRRYENQFVELAGWGKYGYFGVSYTFDERGPHHMAEARAFGLPRRAESFSRQGRSTGRLKVPSQDVTWIGNMVGVEYQSSSGFTDVWGDAEVSYDSSDSTMEVSLTDIKSVEDSSTTFADLSFDAEQSGWAFVGCRNAASPCSRFPRTNVGLLMSMYGPDNKEIGGTFDSGSIVGAFLAVRD